MAETSRIVVTPDDLANGVTIEAGPDYELVSEHFRGPGELVVQVLDEDCHPLPDEEYMLLLEGTVLRTARTSKGSADGKDPQGMIRIEKLPVDIYQIVVRGEKTDVVPRTPGSKVLQVVQFPGGRRNWKLYPEDIPPRPAQGAKGGREWLRWLSDASAEKPVPFVEVNGVAEFRSPPVLRRIPIDTLPSGVVRVAATGELRDHMALAELRKGNVPSFCREWKELKLHHSAVGDAWVRVTPDLLAVGSDEDYIRYPFGAYAAQTIANEWNCFLPTAKIVAECMLHADVPLVGHSMRLDGTNDQRANRALAVHEDIVQGALACDEKLEHATPYGWRARSGVHFGSCQLPKGTHPKGIIAGHKKEVIVRNLQGMSVTGTGVPLSMYGFWYPEAPAAPAPPRAPWRRMMVNDAKGNPYPVMTQNFVWSHSNHRPGYGDYSHGVRLVHPSVRVRRNGATIEEIHSYGAMLGDKDLYRLLVHAEDAMERPMSQETGALLPGSMKVEDVGPWKRTGYVIAPPGTWVG